MVDHLTAHDRHRITYVAGDTWTLFVAGERIQSRARSRSQQEQASHEQQAR